jgi:hypothetical protein
MVHPSMMTTGVSSAAPATTAEMVTVPSMAP